MKLQNKQIIHYFSVDIEFWYETGPNTRNRYNVVELKRVENWNGNIHWSFHEDLDDWNSCEFYAEDCPEFEFERLERTFKEIIRTEKLNRILNGTNS
jgi:hypothetical protein